MNAGGCVWRPSRWKWGVPGIGDSNEMNVGTWSPQRARFSGMRRMSSGESDSGLTMSPEVIRIPCLRQLSSAERILWITFWCLRMSTSVSGLKLSSPTNRARHPERDIMRTRSGCAITLKVAAPYHWSRRGSSASHSARRYARSPPMLLSEKADDSPLVGWYSVGKHPLTREDILDDRLHGTSVMPRTQSRQHAKLAGKRAAAGRLEAQGVVLLSFEEIEARRCHQVGSIGRRDVSLLQGVRTEIRIRARDGAFRVADDHGVEPRFAEIGKLLANDPPMTVLAPRRRQ